MGTTQDPTCPRATFAADRKSTRLNSSHLVISYAVFCLIKKKAATEYQKAIDNKPTDCQAHFTLGRVLVNQLRYTPGVSELVKTIEPDDDAHHRSRGRLS